MLVFFLCWEHHSTMSNAFRKHIDFFEHHLEKSDPHEKLKEMEEEYTKGIIIAPKEICIPYDFKMNIDNEGRAVCIFYFKTGTFPKPYDVSSILETLMNKENRTFKMAREYFKISNVKVTKEDTFLLIKKYEMLCPTCVTEIEIADSEVCLMDDYTRLVTEFQTNASDYMQEDKQKKLVYNIHRCPEEENVLCFAFKRVTSSKTIVKPWVEACAKVLGYKKEITKESIREMGLEVHNIHPMYDPVLLIPKYDAEYILFQGTENYYQNFVSVFRSFSIKYNYNPSDLLHEEANHFHKEHKDRLPDQTTKDTEEKPNDKKYSDIENNDSETDVEDQVNYRNILVVGGTQQLLYEGKEALDKSFIGLNEKKEDENDRKRTKLH